MAIQKWSDLVLLVTPPEDPGFTEDLNEAFGNLTKDPKLCVVIDMNEVTQLNSSNLALLLRLRKALMDNHRELLLCNVTNRAWGVFLVTGLDSLFSFSDDVTTALTTMRIDQDS